MGDTLTSVQCQVDVNVSRLLADMAHATAWIAFTAAQANHDLQRYGEWRCDYERQASIFHADYEKAGRALVELLSAHVKQPYKFISVGSL